MAWLDVELSAKCKSVGYKLYIPQGGCGVVNSICSIKARNYCCVRYTLYNFPLMILWGNFIMLLQLILLVAMSHQMYCSYPGHQVSNEFVLQSHHVVSRGRCAHICMSYDSCDSFNFDEVSQICQLIGPLAEDAISCNFQSSKSGNWYSPKNCGPKKISGNSLQWIFFH